MHPLKTKDLGIPASIMTYTYLYCFIYLVFFLYWVIVLDIRPLHVDDAIDVVLVSL